MSNRAGEEGSHIYGHPVADSLLPAHLLHVTQLQISWSLAKHALLWKIQAPPGVAQWAALLLGSCIVLLQASSISEGLRACLQRPWLL